MSTLSHERQRTARHINWAAYRQQRAHLADLFPAIAAPGQPKQPLAIGVKYDLIGANTGLTPAEVKHFLRAYTFGPKYLRALKAGAWRYDLDCARNGWVSPGEAAHAARCLKTHYEMKRCSRVGLAAVRAALDAGLQADELYAEAA